MSFPNPIDLLGNQIDASQLPVAAPTEVSDTSLNGRSVSIGPEPNLPCIAPDPAVESDNAPCPASPHSVPAHDVFVAPEPKPDAAVGGCLGRVRARNVLRTLAILVSAFRDGTPEYEQVPHLDSDGTLPGARADQIFKTIAVLVDAFSSTATVYRKGGGPNEIAIARHLATLAHDETGQSDEAIRKTLAEARRRWRRNS